MFKTEVYGTLGPACQDDGMIARMFEAGMTGMRLNLSHGGLEQCQDWLKHFQAGARIAKKEPKLLIDLQGPELRIGNVAPHRLEEGEEVFLGKQGVPVPELVFEKLKPGQQVLLDDGKLLLEVREVWLEKKSAGCIVLRGGGLKPRKSLAFPGVALHPPTLTENDLQNLSLAGENGVTGVMLPFVRDAEDLRRLRAVLQEFGAGDLKIFAKIENMDGVKKLPELMPEADVIVIARGDLGNSMPLWELPGVVHRVGEACKAVEKPYLVVTQMLASMEQSQVPTRAEISDIFYAVLHGASAVMLTGETAAGRYPAEAMEYMCRVVEEAERLKGKERYPDILYER